MTKTNKGGKQMDVPKPRCLDDMTKEEFWEFIEEGLEDYHAGRIMDFDTAFNELEKRYSANG